MDYYGSAMFSEFPMAVMDLLEVEFASDNKLIELAKRLGLDLSKYKDI